MKASARTAITTFSTTLVVAVLAAAWAVASPLGVTCAHAELAANLAPAPRASDAFVASINALRASHGLAPLTVDPELTNVAQDWAQQMAENDGISHRLNLRDGITALWKTLGENVGYGPTVTQLMDAFIASPGHYKNLVDPRFTRIGVGTVKTLDGMLYTAHEFEALQSDTPAVVLTTPPPTTTPVTHRTVTTSPAPPVTAPPVTTPPTTVAPPAELPVVVEFLPAKQDQLQDSSANNHEQKQTEGQRNCRAHKSNLKAMIA